MSIICICGTGKEDNEHYLLPCLQFTEQRQDLHGLVSDVGYDIASMNSGYLSFAIMGTEMKVFLQIQSSWMQLSLS